MSSEEVEGLDVPTDGDVTLRARNGVTVTIPSACLQQSDFLKALMFEDDDRTLVVPNIPSIYLRFAALYLRAACQGYNFDDDMTDAQLALVTVRNVVYYPELLQYLYGYLGVISFQAYYQRMLLAAIKEGTMNANIAKHLDNSSLDSLSEEQLYAVSEYQPKRINDLYRIANARNYLLLKIQRNTLALAGKVVLEVRGGQLWVNGSRVATGGRVQSVHVKTQVEAAAVERKYYYLMDGKVYDGAIRGDEIRSANLFDEEAPLLRSLSVGRQWLAGMTEDGLVYMADADDYPSFPPMILELEGVREVVASLSGERLILLMNDGGVQLYDQQIVPRTTVLELPQSIRMAAPDESLVLTNDLQAISGVLQGGVNVSSIPNIYGIGLSGVTFNSRLEAFRNGRLLERGVTAMAFDSYTRRAVFRATNGALRYWRFPLNGETTREYLRRR